MTSFRNYGVIEHGLENVLNVLCKHLARIIMSILQISVTEQLDPIKPENNPNDPIKPLNNAPFGVAEKHAGLFASLSQFLNLAPEWTSKTNYVVPHKCFIQENYFFVAHIYKHFGMIHQKRQKLPPLSNPANHIV